MLWSLLWARIRAWSRDYDRIQGLAVCLIYLQIACSLIGSLGALYTGVLLVNLAIALFALVAIESSSQHLGRTYAVLLACCIALDIAWFIFYSHEIRDIHDAHFGKFSSMSLKIVFWMQVVGFSVRVLSSFLWFQIYRLGASTEIASLYNLMDAESRHGFFNPSSPPARQTSIDDDVLGGSIYDPSYYSSLFHETPDCSASIEFDKHYCRSNGPDASSSLSSATKLSGISRSV